MLAYTGSSSLARIFFRSCGAGFKHCTSSSLPRSRVRRILQLYKRTWKKAVIASTWHACRHVCRTTFYLWLLMRRFRAACQGGTKRPSLRFNLWYCSVQQASRNRALLPSCSLRCKSRTSFGKPDIAGQNNSARRHFDR